MDALRAWFARPVNRLLLVVLALVALFLGDEYVRAQEKRARAAEIETVRLQQMAADLVAVRKQVEEMEAGVGGGEDVVPTVQQLAAARNLSVASAQSIGVKPAGEYQDRTYSIRFRGVPLRPIIDLMNVLETTKSGVEVRELVMRNAVENSRLLDVEFVVAQLVPVKQ